jgi:cytochrome c oxidase assembly factor CtaG
MIAEQRVVSSTGPVSIRWMRPFRGTIEPVSVAFAGSSAPGIRRLGAVILSAGAVAVTAALAVAAPALAHGGPNPDEPGPLFILTGWSFDPLTQLFLLGPAVLYLLAVRAVDRAHPRNPVPGIRTAAWLGGILALELALASGIERYDTTLFSVHMVQHILLTLVAAPLLVLGAPITLVLRVASPAVRRRWILPVLHSRPVRILGHPIVAWILFTVVMWGSHLTPMFDAALEDELLHRIEHALYLSTALLFWWPVVGVDPSPYRMSYPARILYLLLQMPTNTFLAVLVYSAVEPWYPHYVTTGRTWGPSPLLDQQAAGAIMWVWGDLAFLVAGLLMVAAWWRDEERRASRTEGRPDPALLAIREREVALAARLAAVREAAGGVPSSAPPQETSAGSAGQAEGSGASR